MRKVLVIILCILLLGVVGFFYMHYNTENDKIQAKIAKVSDEVSDLKESNESYRLAIENAKGSKPEEDYVAVINKKCKDFIKLQYRLYDKFLKSNHNPMDTPDPKKVYGSEYKNIFKFVNKKDVPYSIFVAEKNQNITYGFSNKVEGNGVVCYFYIYSGKTLKSIIESVYDIDSGKFGNFESRPVA